MTPSLTLTAEIARVILARARDAGHDESRLRKRFGISDEVDHPDGRVSAHDLIRLWHEVPRLLGEEDEFGLLLAEGAGTSAFPLAERMFESSATVGEGLARLFSYQRVLNDVHHSQVAVEGDLLRVSIPVKDSPLPVPRHAIEFVLAWLTLAARRATGRAEIAPLAIAFSHDRPRSTRLHRRIFQCPITFGADVTRFDIDRRVMEQPLLKVDPGLSHILESHAASLLARLPESASFADRVRKAARPLLGQRPKVTTIAKALGMSPRSVQRRLAAEHTSFEAVLSELRQSLAEAHLRERRLSIGEIARELGFSDQSAFHKAFVRWTGKTPATLRTPS
jgi:AraC-like DNA-binding protein